jgi:hypothetical protein
MPTFGRNDRRSTSRLRAALVVGLLTALAAAGVARAGHDATEEEVLYWSHAIHNVHDGYAIVRVPIGKRCQIKLVHHGHVRARSTLHRSGKSGTMEFTWSTPVTADSGRWALRVHCDEGGDSSDVAFTIGHLGSHEAKQSTKFEFRLLPADSIPYIPASRASAGPKGPAVYPRAGLVLLDGSKWFGGNGVPVYSNGRYGGDGPRTSVELFERFINARGWYHGIAGFGGDPEQFFMSVPAAAFEGHRNGGDYLPVPGDAVVFASRRDHTGRVGIVDEVRADGTLLVVEQNAASSGREVITLRDHFLGDSGDGSTVIGVLHAKVNTQQPPPEPSNPPSPPVGVTTGVLAPTFDRPVTGGPEAGSIPARTTVQVYCRVSGSAAADGNTWWYRIASAPWTDQYVSADAFYNNGATDGPLRGTPYVDATVPPC